MPKLYQIHLRQFMKQNSYNNTFNSLRQFPIEFLDYLETLDFQYLWLMGIWQLPVNPLQRDFSLQSFLKEKYSQINPNWKQEDIISSVFAIENYTIDQNLGTIEDYLFLKNEANKRGVKIILDFIPNHFGYYSTLTTTNPELFLKQDDILQNGKDPNYPAWVDTAQVDYSKELTREFMIKQLIGISELCDGVRIDMAMLMLNSVFERTWGFKINFESEFWSEALNIAKNNNKDFITIGECYWDLETQLLDLGFDYVYYKPFLDSLINIPPENPNSEIQNNLNPNKLVYFLENHDEKRSASIWDLEILKTKIDALIQTSGLQLYYHGQLIGNQSHSPIQLVNVPPENPNSEIQNYYLEKLTNI